MDATGHMVNDMVDFLLEKIMFQIWRLLRDLLSLGAPGFLISKVDFSEIGSSMIIYDHLKQLWDQILEFSKRIVDLIRDIGTVRRA